MGRRQQVLVPTGLFLAAAARVRIASAAKLDASKFVGDARRLANDAVREVLAAHRDVERQLSFVAPELAAVDAKIAKLELRIQRETDAETLECASELLDVARVKRANLVDRIAEIESARISDNEIASAIEVANERVSRDTDWANAARAMLACDEIDICDQRAVGCLSRAACRNS